MCLQFIQVKLHIISLELCLGLLCAQLAILVLQSAYLTLQVFNFVHSSELEILAQLCEVLDCLLVLVSAADELLLVSFHAFLQHLDPLLLAHVLVVPHLLPLLVELELLLPERGTVLILQREVREVC